MTDNKCKLDLTMLYLSAAAKTAWIKFHDVVEAELNKGKEMSDIRDVASKAADNAARLAAIFHVLENGINGTVSEDHMQRAAAVVTWHLYEARRFLNEMAMPKALLNAIKLDDWLLKYCRENATDSVAKNQIMQYGPGALRDKPTLEKALLDLTELSRIRQIMNDKKKMIQINPALLLGAA